MSVLGFTTLPPHYLIIFLIMGKHMLCFLLQAFRAKLKVVETSWPSKMWRPHFKVILNCYESPILIELQCGVLPPCLIMCQKNHWRGSPPTGVLALEMAWVGETPQFKPDQMVVMANLWPKVLPRILFGFQALGKHRPAEVSCTVNIWCTRRFMYLSGFSD